MKVATRKKTAGAVKGKSKPLKRVLSPAFSQRLAMAMKAHGWEVPTLAKEVGCTRAALHRYLKGSPKAIDALLLFELSAKLEVNPGWLLAVDSDMAPPRALTADQSRALNTFSLLSPRMREYWISQGEELRALEPALVATTADPYPRAPKPPPR